MPTQNTWEAIMNGYENWMNESSRKWNNDVIELTISTDGTTTMKRGGYVVKDPLELIFEGTTAKHIRSIPGIKKTVFNGDDTVIIWEDGKQTIVTREEDKPYDQYAAFTAAVCKRLFGGTGKVMDIMHKTDEGARAKAAAEKKRKTAEAEKARKAEAHQRKLELEEKRHHELVEEYLRKMRAEKEALAIMARAKKEEGAASDASNC